MLITALDRFIRTSDTLIEVEAFFNDIKEEEHAVYTLELHVEEFKRLW